MISKNYLQEDELGQLNRLVTRFLTFDEREVLNGPGRVSAERMKIEVAERYVAWDEGRRAREAEEAAVEEAELDQLVLTMLAKTPAARPSAEQVYDVLEP